MITNDTIYDQLLEATPNLFDPTVRTPTPLLAITWHLPADRILFATEQRQIHTDTGDAIDTGDAAVYLYVLDPHTKRVRTAGSFTGYPDLDAAIVGAIEWMQGLRNEDLTDIDPALFVWLGEMTWRLTPDQLQTIEDQYRALPPQTWDRIASGADPDPHLVQLLRDMGFSDTYLAAHLI